MTAAEQFTRRLLAEIRRQGHDIAAAAEAARRYGDGETDTPLTREQATLLHIGLCSPIPGAARLAARVAGEMAAMDQGSVGFPVNPADPCRTFGTSAGLTEQDRQIERVRAVAALVREQATELRSAGDDITAEDMAQALTSIAKRIDRALAGTGDRT